MKTLNKLVLFSLTFFGLLMIPDLASAQGVGGGGHTGGGFFLSSKCKEGNRSLFSEKIPGQDKERAVWRTCHNGSYYDLSEYIYNPKFRCASRAEGQLRRVLQASDGENNEWAWFVCRSGEWRRKKAD